MTWPWPDLDLTWSEVKFLNWLFKIKQYIFRTGSTRPIRWHYFFYCISHSKKEKKEKPSLWKTIIFHLMTSGAKTVNLRSNLIETRYWGMERAIHCFFILPSYHTFGVNSYCSRKNRYFLKIWPLVMFGDLTIDLTWKWPCKSLRSRRVLCNAVCCLSLSSAVFFRTDGGDLKPPPHTEPVSVRQ